MTLRFLTYATFLPQNDEQIKGLSPSLAYGTLDLIEKSSQRNEADESLAVNYPFNVFAIPITFPLTGIFLSSVNSRPRLVISYSTTKFPNATYILSMPYA